MPCEGAWEGGNAYLTRVKEITMKTIRALLALPVLGAASYLYAASDALVVTSSNTAQNQLLVYNSSGSLLQSVPTQGQGGVGGNAGGIQAKGNLLAVVNFGSQSVTLFERDGSGFQVKQVLPAVSNPVSVAFGTDHLYVLGTTTVESHRLFGATAAIAPDGVSPLLLADGSSAQVGVLPGELVITEKSNVIETVSLLGGAVSGFPTLVQNIPANVNAPFGLVTRGDAAYVTIAHADEISLVRKDAVLTTTASGTQHAPCWLTLAGPFLFSSNSPSMSISRYVVAGQQIVQDAAIAASLIGSPTDIASGAGLVAVIDGSGGISRVSIFALDDQGNLVLQGSASIASAANGVAVVAGGN
jgi:hypothetical protein